MTNVGQTQLTLASASSQFGFRNSERIPLMQGLVLFFLTLTLRSSMAFANPWASRILGPALVITSIRAWDQGSYCNTTFNHLWQIHFLKATCYWGFFYVLNVLVYLFYCLEPAFKTKTMARSKWSNNQQNGKQYGPDLWSFDLRSGAHGRVRIHYTFHRSSDYTLQDVLDIWRPQDHRQKVPKENFWA